MEWDRSQTSNPWKALDCKFTVHFSLTSHTCKDSGKEEPERKVRRVTEKYEPTIVCYNRHDHVMEVKRRTDERTDMQTDSLLFLFTYITCRYTRGSGLSVSP